MDTKGYVDYWMGLHKRGRVRIYATCGLKGYVILLDVASHEELNMILEGNPIWQHKEYITYPLTPIENIEV